MGFDVLSKLPQLLLISVLCALVELVPIGSLTTALGSILFVRSILSNTLILFANATLNFFSQVMTIFQCH